MLPFVGKPQFSPTTGLGKEIKLRLPPFSLICIQCLHAFCFWFCNIQPLTLSKYANKDIFIYDDTDSMTTHTGLFQILFLGSCPPSTDWKLSLISLARYVISGQTYMETSSLSRYDFIMIRFQINYHSLEKHANFILRQGATNCKVQG